MDWIRILEVPFFLIIVPALLAWLFPNTWKGMTFVAECKNRVLILRFDGSMDAFFLGGILLIGYIHLRDPRFDIMILLISIAISGKLMLDRLLRIRYEISAAGIRYQKYFSRGFMAWDDIVEINIVAPERRLMFRSDRAKIVISLLPSEHLQYAFDAPRVAQLIARFARKKLRHRTNIMWCT